MTPEEMSIEEELLRAKIRPYLKSDTNWQELENFIVRLVDDYDNHRRQVIYLTQYAEDLMNRIHQQEQEIHLLLRENESLRAQRPHKPIELPRISQ